MVFDDPKEDPMSGGLRDFVTSWLHNACKHVLQQLTWLLTDSSTSDFLAAIAALYLGSSLTDSLTHGIHVRAISHNSVIFQARTFKLCMVVHIDPTPKLA